MYIYANININYFNVKFYITYSYTKYTFMKNFNRIGEVLKKQGRSQKWLSEQIGRARVSVNYMCSNKTQPSLKLLFEIADVLNVTPCQLIGDGSDIEESKP